MKGCVYCPKCEKSVPKEELEERAKQLYAMFGDKSLATGRCPVCGTMMIDVDKAEEKRKKKGS